MKGSYAKPLIDMHSPTYDANRAAQFIITVDFSDLISAQPNPYPKVYSDDPIILPPDPDPDVVAPIPIAINALRRDVAYSSSGRETEFKRFTNDDDSAFASTDTYSFGGDLSDTAWSAISTSPNQAQVALYVLSYGFDSSTSSVLYSDPVYLGAINNIQFPVP
jgi:hypothetical protein